MKRVAIDLLEKKVIEKLQRAGVSDEHARVVATVLIDADAKGITSHGTVRLQHYIQRIKAGGINLSSEFPISEGNFAWTYCLDAQGGLGHIACLKATQKSVEVANKQGIAVVSIRNTSHCGALSYYVEQITRAGLICFVTLNTDKCVVPTGGKDSYFGTNPIAWGFPSKDKNPVIVDMATSETSLGSVLQAQDEGEEIPNTWAVDKDGRPTTNPKKAKALLPMAAHKGYALAFVAETLSALLTGSVFGPQLVRMYGELDKTRDLSAFFMVFRSDLYVSQDTFAQGISKMVGELHAEQTAEGVDKIMVPGEPQWKARQRSLSDGVVILDVVHKFLGW